MVELEELLGLAPGDPAMKKRAAAFRAALVESAGPQRGQAE
jgi:hypothetical protein